MLLPLVIWIRDLTKKTLFFVALATTKRFGELQAILVKVARSGGDMQLAYFPEFVAKTKPATKPIPKSFLFESFSDFAGTLKKSYCYVQLRH